MLKQRLVKGCNVLRGGAVNENGVEDVHLDDAVEQLLCIRRLRSIKLFSVIAEVDALAAEYSFLGRGYAHHVEQHS